MNFLKKNWRYLYFAALALILGISYYKTSYSFPWVYSVKKEVNSVSVENKKIDFELKVNKSIKPTKIHDGVSEIQFENGELVSETQNCSKDNCCAIHVFNADLNLKTDEDLSGKIYRTEKSDGSNTGGLKEVVISGSISRKGIAKEILMTCIKFGSTTIEDEKAFLRKAFGDYLSIQFQ